MPKGIPKNQKLVDEILYRLCAIEIREKVSRDSQDAKLKAIEDWQVQIDQLMKYQPTALIERIAALEVQFAKWVNTINYQIDQSINARTKDPLGDASNMIRIAALERRIAEMNEAFSHARFPRAPQQEQVRFT